MATMSPYLNFPGQAREAMEFYQSVLGGELSVNTFGEFGMTDGPQKDLVMHSQLETGDGFVLMAADLMPGMEHVPGNNVTISLSGAEEALRGYFDGLAAGGAVGTALARQVWGDEYGDLVDKFGIRWLVNVVDAKG